MGLNYPYFPSCKAQFIAGPRKGEEVIISLLATSPGCFISLNDIPQGKEDEYHLFGFDAQLEGDIGRIGIIAESVINLPGYYNRQEKKYTPTNYKNITYEKFFNDEENFIMTKKDLLVAGGIYYPFFEKYFRFQIRVYNDQNQEDEFEERLEFISIIPPTKTPQEVFGDSNSPRENQQTTKTNNKETETNDKGDFKLTTPKPLPPAPQIDPSEKLISIFGIVQYTSPDSTETTGELIPVSNARVIIKRHSGKSVRTRTDINGKYQVSVPENSRSIYARHSGGFDSDLRMNLRWKETPFKTSQTEYNFGIGNISRAADNTPMNPKSTYQTPEREAIAGNQGIFEGDETYKESEYIERTRREFDREAAELNNSVVITEENDPEGFDESLYKEDLDVETVIEENKITIAAEGYESKEIIPYKGDGTPKEDLGTIELTPIDKSLESDIITNSQLSEESIKALSSSSKTADYYIMKRLLKTINGLKGTLIPLVLGMLSKFGITKAQDLMGKGKNEIKNKIVCPPQEQLLTIIKKKNKLVKGLNNTLKIIDATTKTLGIVGGIITSIEISYNFLAFVPLPIPPAVPIALTKLERLIGKLKAGNTGLLALLVLLQQTISMIINLLNMLDIALQTCSPDTEEEQTQINEELRALIEDQESQNNSPVIKIVNGFTMDLETENTPNPLKRKRAIAKNADGVTILKGEWSFSSIDQILIDELVFYIQNNNLKAD